MARRSIDASHFATKLDDAGISIYTLAARSGIVLWKIKALLRKGFTPSGYTRKRIYTALSSSDNYIFPVIT